MPGRSVSILTCAILLAGDTAQAAPPVPLIRSVTYSSYEQAGSVRLPLFDPAKGILRGAKVTTNGLVTLELKPGGPVKAAVPYAYKVGFYIYYGPHNFHLMLDGSTTLEPYKGSYMLYASGKGAEDVAAGALDALKGRGTIGLTFSSDLPKPMPPAAVPMGSLTATKHSGSVTITYTYLFAPKVETKLPKGTTVPQGGLAPKP